MMYGIRLRRHSEPPIKPACKYSPWIWTRSNSRIRSEASRANSGEYPNLDGHLVGKQRTSNPFDSVRLVTEKVGAFAPQGNHLPGRSRSLLNNEIWAPW